MTTPGWPDDFTYNFCPNPSAAAGINGYTALHADSVSPEALRLADFSFTGSTSVGVVTPGVVPGEGVATPIGQIIADATGSAQLEIFGETGLLVVSAVAEGTILGSAPVILNGSWQQVVINGLAMTAGETFQLLVQTTVVEQASFLVNAVQYEPESPAHAYVDGDQPYCAWTGTPEDSPSFRQFQNPISFSGGMVLGGTIDFVATGEVFSIGNADPSAGPVVLIEGLMDISGQDHPMVATTQPGRAVIPPAIDTGIDGLPWEISGGGTASGFSVVSPGGGLGLFAVWETGVDVDPALSLIGPNNEGTLSGQESYNRVYGMFTPPLQQLDSQGAALWQSAAYMAVGFKVASLAASTAEAPNGVNFCDVQVEKVPLVADVTPVPSAYQLPRALNTIVKPDGLNFITNPAFQVSTAGWTASGGAGIALDTSFFFTGKPAASGTQSLQVTAPTSGAKVSVSIPELIAGDEYVVFAHVAAMSDNIEDIFLNVGSASASANTFGDPLYGGDPTFPGYGSGPYGGVLSSTTAMTEADWLQPVLIFTAPASTVSLSLSAVPVTGGTGNMLFNVDAVMLSTGQAAPAYADGNTDEWQWELGGTPGLSRSYFYQSQQVAARALETVLEEHIPLGISATDPVYRQPFTQ
jgi:hypothetical protein